MQKGKLVLLKLSGTLDKGFHVGIEIGPVGARPNTELRGFLPENQALIHCLKNWRILHRQHFVGISRLKPKNITYNISIKNFGKQVSNSDSLSDAINHFGMIFKKWLKSEKFKEIDTKIRGFLYKVDDIQVIVQSDDYQVYFLPWYLWDLISEYPYADVSICPAEFRRQEDILRRRKLPENKKVNVLAVWGDREGIDIEFDKNQLRKTEYRTHSSLHLKGLSQPSIECLNKELKNGSQYGGWDIFFFAGHGETIEEKGKIYINKNESITLDEIKDGLTRAVSRGLKVAIFNSCDGLGLAKELSYLHIPYLIVMKELIPDEVAQQFLVHFIDIFSCQKMNLPLHLTMLSVRNCLKEMEKNFPGAMWLPTLIFNPTEDALTWKELRDYEHCRKAKESKKNYENFIKSNNITSKIAKVVEDISYNSPGYVRLDSTYWKAYLDECVDKKSVIKAEQFVSISSREGNVLLVQPGEPGPIELLDKINKTIEGQKNKSYSNKTTILILLFMLFLATTSLVAGIKLIQTWGESLGIRTNQENNLGPLLRMDREVKIHERYSEIPNDSVLKSFIIDYCNGQLSDANFRASPGGKQLGIVKNGMRVNLTGVSRGNFYEAIALYWVADDQTGGQWRESVGWLHQCWID